MTRYRNFLICMLSATLAACVSSRDIVIPTPEQDAQESQLDALGNSKISADAPVSAWWETLDDTQLSALINLALEKNKDVKIAIASLAEARGIAREAGADRLPNFNTSVSGQRVRSSEALGIVPGDRTSDVYDAGFDAAWELDLFGRVASRIEASDARQRAALDALRNVYVTIAAEVARTYAEYRGAQYRLRIAKRNSANQKETYDIAVSLSEAGRSSRLDVTRAFTQLELTLSTLPTFEAQVVANVNRLSVLTGQVPSALVIELALEKPIPTIPTAVNIGSVSNLILRRPDIQQAKNELEASIADYNVSVANQFPVVNFVGILGFSASSLSNFGTSALNSSGGATVSWSIFDMNRVRAQIDQNDARAQRAVAVYEKTVLEALEEFQTAVSNFSKEEVRRERLQRAAFSSKESATLARERYSAGIDSFIDVLSAESTLLEAEDSLAQSDIQTLLRLIAIYKSLGGGWQVVADKTGINQ